jgi:uncharacterized protein (DUF433 family)
MGNRLPVDYRQIISVERGKRGGKPCIRGMRITVGDILGWLAAGMSREQICGEYPELTGDDITAALLFAADFTDGGWRAVRPDDKATAGC